jgi:hypothetical protein
MSRCWITRGIGPVPRPVVCPYTVGGFVNNPLGKTETVGFNAQFDAIPGRSFLNGGVIGLSQGAAHQLTDLAVIVAFTSAGTIVARDYDHYAARNVIPYSAGVPYHFWLFVDVRDHNYWAWVAAPGGAAQLLADGFRFRFEQRAVTSLDHWVMDTVAPDSEDVCNFTLQ